MKCVPSPSLAIAVYPLPCSAMPSVGYGCSSGYNYGRERCEFLKEIDGSYYELICDLIPSDLIILKISKTRIASK
jgi:hypothetical protein